jgi:hypothetical protein
VIEEVVKVIPVPLVIGVVCRNLLATSIFWTNPTLYSKFFEDESDSELY